MSRYNNDRKQYNNDLLRLKCPESTQGFGIFIQILIIIGALIVYGCYKGYKYYKKKK